MGHQVDRGTDGARVWMGGPRRPWEECGSCIPSGSGVVFGSKYFSRLNSSITRHPGAARIVPWCTGCPGPELRFWNKRCSRIQGHESGEVGASLKRACLCGSRRPEDGSVLRHSGPTMAPELG